MEEETEEEAKKRGQMIRNFIGIGGTNVNRKEHNDLNGIK
jgi:hypothetical protein